MFRNETFVQWAFVLALAVFTGGRVHGQESSEKASESSTGRDLADRLLGKSNCAVMIGQKTKEDLDAFLERNFADIKNKDERLRYAREMLCPNESAKEDVCRNASKDFRDAMKDSIKACHSFDKGGEAGNIGCAHAIERCFCNEMNGSLRAEKPLCQATAPAGSDLTARLQNCPAEAAKDIDRLQSEVDKLKPNVRALRKEMEQAREKAAKEAQQAVEQTGEKRRQIRDQEYQAAKEKKEADDRTAEKLSENRDKKEKAASELVQQLLQLDQELNRIEERRGQVQTKRHAAEMKHADTIMQIELQCYSGAVNQVTEQQKVETAKLVANIRQLGGFNTMLRFAGKSERQVWKEEANARYDDCMRSRPTRSAKSAAGRAKNIELVAADKEERKIDLDRQNVEARMRRIRDQNCAGEQRASNGDSGESAMCANIRNASLEEQRILKSARAENDLYRQKLAMLRQNKNEIQAEGLMKLANSNVNGMGAAEDYGNEASRLADLERELALKKSLSRGKRMTEAEFNEAQAKYDVMKMSAITLVNCQHFRPKQAGTPSRCTADCRQAAELLGSVGYLSPSQMSEIRSSAGSGEYSPGGGDGRLPVIDSDPHGMKK